LRDDGPENIQSSPCERITLGMDGSGDEEVYQAPSVPLKRIVPLVNRGLGAQLLTSSLGGAHRSGRQHYAYPVHGKLLMLLI
jgi:hypothetical protein